MMHDMRDLQCLNVGITPGCYRREVAAAARRWRPLRAVHRRRWGSAAPLSPILHVGSSTPPPAGELVLLCSRNPRYLCGGSGEARWLDLTVTHPLLLLLHPMSSSPDPLFLVFFGSADPHNIFYGS